MDREGFAKRKFRDGAAKIDFSLESLTYPSFYTMAAFICGGCRKSRIAAQLFAKVSRKFRVNFAKVGVRT